MARRLDLHNELLKFSNNVYFQPPESIEIKIPCIIYERSSGLSEYANNKTYKYGQAYSVKYVSKDPDCEDIIKGILESFPMSRFNRHYVSNNLNYDDIILYY